MDSITVDHEMASVEAPSVELELCLAVYREVWVEFYNWEADYCSDVLQSLSLANPEVQNDLESSHTWSPSRLLDDSEIPLEFLVVKDGQESFSVEDFDEEGNAIRIRILRVVEGCSDSNGDYDNFNAYPRYEFCTPVSQNYVQVDNTGMLSFLPYADDPKFGFEEYLGYFRSFSWQNDFFDPDSELIALEAVTRLYFNHNYSLSDIGHSGLFRPLRENRSSGLLWETAQRDIPWWTGIGDEPKIRDELELTTFDFLENIDRDIQHFCPLLGCLRFFCQTHPDPYPGLDKNSPKLTEDRLREECKNPCGIDCFKHAYDDDMPLDTLEEENEDTGSFTEQILKVIPDEMPCNLAIICRKKCIQVFRTRCRMYDDEDIDPCPISDDSQQLRKKPYFVDNISGEGVAPEFAIPPPCRHAGPCDRFSCSCYSKKQHCQRSCRCSEDCIIRWKGCACHSRKNKSRSRLDPEDKPCKSNSCRCRKAGRECDPDLCLPCDARGYKHRKWCQNVSLQRGDFPQISIGPGAYGLGAFAAEAISDNLTIGEYVGEIITINNTDNDAVRMIHSYTNLNYLFDLNGQDALDSAKLGNETRFLNDPKGSGVNANCKAKVVSVNGQHRIAFYSVSEIEKGEELLLSYGENYWNPGTENSPTETANST